MKIDKIKIKNFKCFEDDFVFKLNEGINILVGNNEAGKSTILEAIHLALSGTFNNRYLKNELSQFLFNNEVVKNYIKDLEQGSTAIPPEILIELYFSGEGLEKFKGVWNSEKNDSSGVVFKIAFDENYREDYQELISKEKLESLPIEYYEIYWNSFSGERITSRILPIKSSFIDSSKFNYNNNSDVYISQIVKNNLETEKVVNISQAYRKMIDNFKKDTSIKAINESISKSMDISSKEVELSVELSTKNSWEKNLLTFFDEVPFRYIGKGEQCVIKTELALSNKRTKQSNIILIEEPENHLSYSKLNQFVRSIKDSNENKQIIISTHNSFIANKLGLDNITMLNDKKEITFNDLSSETKKFFEKISGYDTLRLILNKKIILVEGDSDELVVQKAYMIENNGRLPIEDEIDVMSVGISFLRFLEIAEKLNNEVVVITDNDGDIETLERKYKNYIGVNQKSNIKICYDDEIDKGELKISGKKFNYNTLEPKFLKANSLEKINELLDEKYTEEQLYKYMNRNKTEFALKVFDAEENLNFPDYILRAIRG